MFEQSGPGAERGPGRARGIESMQRMIGTLWSSAEQAPVKRNRFITLTGGTKKVNRQLEAKARALAGIKGYITNIDKPSAEFVIGAYHRLFQIERSFRMSKHDLKARPIYHHKRESIDAHLTIVPARLCTNSIRVGLERAGLIIRKPNPNDRRGVLIEINPQSRARIRL